MSKDTIYREDAIKLLVDRACEKPDHGASAEYLMVDEIEYYLKNLPSADRSQGEWIHAHEGTIAAGLYCSNCGKHGYGEKFCPNCGARMKGADDEKL